MSRPRLLDLKGGVVQIDEADFDLVSSMTGWHVNGRGYVVAFTWRPRRATLMHRLITTAGPGAVVDHINGDKLDNRRSNLRVTNQTINQANRKRLSRANTSGVRGVGRAFGKWRAQITANRRNIHLGLFETLDEAVAARKTAERELWGEEAP